MIYLIKPLIGCLIIGVFIYLIWMTWEAWWCDFDDTVISIGMTIIYMVPIVLGIGIIIGEI